MGSSYVRNSLFALAALRLKLMLKQKVGWMTLVAGFIVIFLSGRIAVTSFANPEKIFWDFSLGASFVIQALLALYFASQLLHDEQSRGTLALTLAASVPRSHWIWGQGLGIWLGLLAMNLSWLLFSMLWSLISFGLPPVLILFQVQVLVAAEMAVVIFLALFISLYLRPLLALLSVTTLFVFLHSLSGLQRILSDPQSGDFVENRGLSVVLFLARLFPPLEWWDARAFVGYAPALDTTYFAKALGLAFLWFLLLAQLCKGSFESKDT